MLRKVIPQVIGIFYSTVVGSFSLALLPQFLKVDCWFCVPNGNINLALHHNVIGNLVVATTL